MKFILVASLRFLLRIPDSDTWEIKYERIWKPVLKEEISLRNFWQFGECYGAIKPGSCSVELSRRRSSRRKLIAHMITKNELRSDLEKRTVMLTILGILVVISCMDLSLVRKLC